jgi:hypothetical protein
VQDANVRRVREQLAERAALGLSKYGVTTERGDLSRLQWLRHAQEEALDLAVYLERLIAEEISAGISDKPEPENQLKTPCKTSTSSASSAATGSCF